MPVVRNVSNAEIERVLRAGRPRLVGVLQTNQLNKAVNNADTLLPFSIAKGVLVMLRGTTDVAIETSASSSVKARRYGNEFLQSEAFDNASWTKTSFGGPAAPVVTANDGVAPDGSTTAEKIDFGAVTSGQSQQVNQTGVVASGTRTAALSVWLKRTGAGTGGLTVQGYDGGALKNELILDQTTLTSSWQRYVVGVLGASAGSPHIKILKGFVNNATNDGAISVHAWGAQCEEVEAGAIPTSFGSGIIGSHSSQGPYIQTTTVAAFTPKGHFLNAGVEKLIFMGDDHQYLSVIPLDVASALAPLSVYEID